MRVCVVPTLIGVFAVDERNKVAMFKGFGNDPKKCAEKFKLSQIEMLEEERAIKVELGKKGFREFVFGYRKGGERNIEPNNAGEVFVKENMKRLAVEQKFCRTPEEFTQFLTKATIELAKVHIKRAIKRDGLIVQVSGALDDLDKSINISMERLREWYGLHFPEMNREIQSHEKFATIVAKFGSRRDIEDAQLEKYKEDSMGADFKDEDVQMMQVFARKVLEMYELREKLTKYSEEVLKEVAPNTLDIAGVALATKLIAKAGGMDRLSRMPSSTVQLIGAEKALFRFLKGKGKSPRHGLIFSHPLIQGARDEKRGKLARLVASKISIAAKVDYYSGKYKGDAMKNEMMEKAKNIVAQRD